MFDDARSSLNSALEDWSEVAEFLQTAKGPGEVQFNQEATIPGTNQELWWFDERVSAIASLSGTLPEQADSGIPLPIAQIDTMNAAAQHIASAVSEMLEAVKETKNQGINNLDPGSWVVVLNNTNTKYNFASFFQNLQKNIEEFLSYFYPISMIVGAQDFEAFTHATREVSECLEKVREQTNAAKRGLSKIDELAAAAEKNSEDASDKQKEITNLLEQAKTNIIDINAANEASQTKLEEVANISSRADALRNQVDGYAAQFEKFESALEGRNKAFDEWSNNVEALVKSFEERKNDIEATVKRAEEMLTVSTNAGLASAFETERNNLDKKLRRAQIAFYISIALLIVSAVPLSAYLFAVTTQASTPQLADSGERTADFLQALSIAMGTEFSPTSTLALALLMVPTIWLTKFSAARHHQLFMLREHYQYKLSLAMSVEGFKKQAPEHQDAIAAETFNRLLFNPADSLEGKEADRHPGPLMNWLMEKFGFNASGKEKK